MGRKRKDPPCVTCEHYRPTGPERSKECDGCGINAEHYKAKIRPAVAVDFDGCICYNAFPAIGAPIDGTIMALKARKARGWGIILWTCREGESLEAALEACRGWGLEFDAVNESLPEWIEKYGTKPRKVGATEYWDDRAIHMGER